MLVLEPTMEAQWQALIAEAASATGAQLDEELESYLVFLLMRFTREQQLAHQVLALEFLRAHQQLGQRRQTSLRDVGDHCLLFSGLFPRRAERRRVRLGYYVDLGRGAYHSLAGSVQDSLSGLYHHLAQAFVAMMDVLQATRTLHDAQALMSPLSAYELWNDTGSERARQQIMDEDRILVRVEQEGRH